MLDDNTIDYYRGREARELHLASKANDPMIARIHRDLAERYRERIEQVTITPRLRA